MAERVVKVKLLAQVSDYEKGMLAAAQATRTVGTESEKLAQKKQAFEQVGRGLALTGAAITAVTALSVKAALDWESAWAGVTKTVDGSEEQMAELEQGLRGLAQTLPATHQEIAAVAEAAGQLGVAREDVVDFTRTMIDLSETTNLSADEAATSIAQLMNVMQTAPEDVDNLGAALVALGNDGASTERDIIQMAQRIAGAGRVVGLTEAQVLGFANALASVGIEAEAGGSAISRIMTDIAMSVSSGGEKLDQFAKVAGMSSTDFQKAFKEAPAEAIATFIEGLGRINDSGGDVFQTLSNLGQTDIRVSQALLGMANSGDLLRKSLDLGSQAWKENTALAAEAAKRYETTEARIQIAGNAVRDAAIDFGEVFLPAVGAAADGVAEFAQFMGGLPDPVQGIIGVLTATVGVLALAGGTALAAVPKFAEFKAAFQTLEWSMKSFALVGGGAVLALTALVTVVGTVASAQADARARAQSYADALRETGSAADEAARDLVAANLSTKESFGWLESDSALDAAEKLGISIKLVADAAEGNADAQQKLRKEMEFGGLGTQEFNDKLADLGLTLTDYQRLSTTVTQAVERETNARGDGLKLIEQQKEATEESADASQTAADAYLEESGAVEDLNSQLTQLIDSINTANGVNQDAITANIDYQATLREVEEQIANISEGVEGFGRGLDITTAAGASNKAMLVELAKDAWDAAAAQLELDGNTATFTSTLESSRQKLYEAAIAMGATDEEAAALRDSILAIPDQKAINIIANTAFAQNEIDSYISRNTGREIILKIGTSRVAQGPGGSGGITFADGGITSKGVKSFADGGFEPGIYPYRPGGIHKFAEESDEAYISMNPARKERSYGVWQEVGNRFGFQQASSSASAGPMAISGTLDLGNGLVGIVKGMLTEYDSAQQRKIRRGVA